MTKMTEQQAKFLFDLTKELENNAEQLLRSVRGFRGNVCSYHEIQNLQHSAEDVNECWGYCMRTINSMYFKLSNDE